MKSKVVFISGTRADYGKIKPLIMGLELQSEFEVFVYVTGMHLLEEYGNTYKEIIKDGYQNIYVEKEINMTKHMDVNLANVVLAFSSYVKKIAPDFIVVHGDRVDALAGAIVGMLNNIKVVHIEGGEVTGTVDDSIRHAISKMAHIHFVANEESKIRLIQLGEKEESIYVIGSPDIDIMLSSDIPLTEEVSEEYGIPQDKYAIFMYHPVVTELEQLKGNIECILNVLVETDYFYVMVYPNNDLGSEIIVSELEKMSDKMNGILTKSIPFEKFLGLLKGSKFIIGNSSAGIREACIYGIPCINIGTRQNQRYDSRVVRNVISVHEDAEEIQLAIADIDKHRIKSNYYGNGNSRELFVKSMKQERAKKTDIQKVFVDIDDTQNKINTFINEVCF